jgi:elongation of very long chain fatty acids protein 7
MAISEGFWDVQGDPRVKDFFLMSSPTPVILLCVGYVVLTKYIGPRIMKNRKPFELRSVMIVYNLLNVLINAYLFVEALNGGWWGKFSFRCEPVTRNTPDENKYLPYYKIGHYYFLLKLFEFGDGIFFVLRKKFSQISNLHVVHHSVMPISGEYFNVIELKQKIIFFSKFSVWLGCKLVPEAQSSFFALLNTFVHVFMYGYYLVTSCGVSTVPKWKKYITILQLTQFVAIMIHSFQIFFIPCDYPKAVSAFIGVHAALFFWAFSKFYYATYIKNPSKTIKTR